MYSRIFSAKVSTKTAEGRRLWDALRKMEIEILELSRLYHGVSTFLEPFEYKDVRSNCIEQALVLKNELDGDEFSWVPVLPVMPWSTSSATTLCYFEKILSCQIAIYKERYYPGSTLYKNEKLLLSDTSDLTTKVNLILMILRAISPSH